MSACACWFQFLFQVIIVSRVSEVVPAPPQTSSSVVSKALPGIHAALSPEIMRQLRAL